MLTNIWQTWPQSHPSAGSPPLDVQPSYPAGAELAGLGSSCATPPWLLMPLAEARQAATAGQPDKMVAAVNVTADSVFVMQLCAPKQAATRLGKLVRTDRVPASMGVRQTELQKQRSAGPISPGSAPGFVTLTDGELFAVNEGGH